MTILICFIMILIMLKNELKNIVNNYVQSSLKVQKWEALFYSTFNRDKFLSLLK